MGSLRAEQRKLLHDRGMWRWLRSVSTTKRPALMNLYAPVCTIVMRSAG